MKQIIFIFALLIWNQIWSQEKPVKVDLVINGASIKLEVDTSRSIANYTMFNCPELIKTKVNFEDIPSTYVESTDSYGQPYNFYGDRSEFLVGKYFNCKTLGDVSIEVSIDNKVASDLRFAYQVLSKSERVTSHMTNIKSDSLTPFLNELCGNLNKPIILIYAIQHTTSIGHIITFDLGYLAFEIEQ